jgi:hypothetical protein
MKDLKRLFRLAGALWIPLLLLLNVLSVDSLAGTFELRNNRRFENFRPREFERQQNNRWTTGTRSEVLQNFGMELKDERAIKIDKRAFDIMIEQGVTLQEAKRLAQDEANVEEQKLQRQAEEKQARLEARLAEEIRREGFSEKKIAEIAGEERPAYEQKKDALVKAREKRKEQIREAKVVSKQKIIAPLSTRPLRKNGQRVITIPSLGR